MTDALAREIDKAHEKLREIDDSLTVLDPRRAGVKRRISYDGAPMDRRSGGTNDSFQRGGDGERGIGKRQRLSTGGANEDDDFDGRPRKTLQSTVVMPSIETKSREQKIEEMNKGEKKETATRNRRMFSNLLMGTLNRFQKDEKKIATVEKIQVAKLKEVEDRLEEKKREEKEKLLGERRSLLDKRREQEKELQSLTRKKALIQYAEAKQDHYKLLMNFIQTSTKPTLFFAPAKHNLRSLELLKNSQKSIESLMELRQKELERELANDKPSERDDEPHDAMRSFVASGDRRRSRERESDQSGDEDEDEQMEDEKPVNADEREDEENDGKEEEIIEMC